MLPRVVSVRDGNSEDLVRRAAGGDVAAVDALLLRYLPELEGYVARQAGAVLRQRESRSDLVQSVCREVLEDVRSQRFEYRGERQFRQWLYRVALRKVQGRGRFLGDSYVCVLSTNARYPR